MKNMIDDCGVIWCTKPNIFVLDYISDLLYAYAAK